MIQYILHQLKVRFREKLEFKDPDDIFYYFLNATKKKKKERNLLNINN